VHAAGRFGGTIGLGRLVAGVGHFGGGSGLRCRNGFRAAAVVSRHAVETNLRSRVDKVGDGFIMLESA